jgi:hypothetical protein
MVSIVSGCDMKVKNRWALLISLLVVVLQACSSSPLRPPYPAYVAVDELPDAYVAGLPGVRAKHLSGDPRTQRASYRIELPADWSFTTGASPGQSIEIYVLAGAIQLGEFSLTEGGYVYLPPGMSGLQMKSTGGALILYFLDEADDAAVIQTPLLTSSELIDWSQQDIGVSVKELRADPGSGARTWLLNIRPEAILSWQKSSQMVEAYLVSGAIDYSECNGDQFGTDEYLPGGYYHRPPGAIHAGPATQTANGAVWFMRVLGAERVEIVEGCSAQE